MAYTYDYDTAYHGPAVPVVGPFTHAALEVIGNRQSDDIIVGRDVLNHMIVTLNGLANVVELSY